MFEEMGIKATVVDGENYINVENFIAYLANNVEAASADIVQKYGRNEFIDGYLKGMTGLATGVMVTLLMDKIIEDSIDTFLDSL